MGLSLNQAAKQGKVAKTTLLRALNSGKCTGTKDENGQWDIDEAELLRWSSTRSKKPRQEPVQNRLDHPEKPPENSVLEREVELLREQLDQTKNLHDRERRQLEERIEDLREERDEWRKQAKSTTLLLENQQGQGDETPTEPQKLSWRERFSGKRKLAS